jgi:parallel beta-helix repeat protein
MIGVPHIVMSLNTKKLIIFVSIGLVCSVGFVTFGEAQQLLLSDNKSINSSGIIIANKTIENYPSATPFLNISPSPKPTFIIAAPTMQAMSSPTPAPTKLIEDVITLQDNSYSLVTAGGELPVESNLTSSSYDIIHLNSKGLNLESNMTIRNLIIDATNLGERFAVVIRPGVENVLIENVTVLNHFALSAALLSKGSNVTLRNINFVNVSQAYPIHIASSHTLVEGCFSKDKSVKALIFIDGQINDIHINNNLAANRPLVYAWEFNASSHDIWLVNNTLINFPNPTYGIIFLGTTGIPQQGLFSNITIIGNKIQAGALAFNAIAIYGFTSNVLVENNTVDQSLSYHNAIGISSGINVVVNRNTVFGSIEAGEGAIEVESNPVHNSNTGYSENVNVTNNIVYNSNWGIYVRVYATDHPNWNGTLLLSKNILIENNTVSNCYIGINLLYGEDIIVRNNYISAKTAPILVDSLNVLDYTVTDNVNIP